MQTLYFLHGALGASQQFESIIHRLHKTYHCKAIDFPMHGCNSMQSAWTIQNFAHYLIKMIEENESEKVSVFGYSMGAYVAIYAASLRPDLFDKIITLATKLHWNEAIALKEVAMLNTEKMELKIPAFVEQLKQRHKHTDWKEIVHNTASLLTELGIQNLLHNEILSQLQTKIMLGVGDKDEAVTFEETIAAYRQLQHGSLYILPSTKHPFEKVNEELLVTHINSFMNS